MKRGMEGMERYGERDGGGWRGRDGRGGIVKGRGKERGRDGGRGRVWKAGTQAKC